jgi:hypothetical protein
MRDLKIGNQANGKTRIGKGKCPLSSIRGEDGKYLRKIKVEGTCVNPTTTNQRRKGSEELARQKSMEAKAKKNK